MLCGLMGIAVGHYRDRLAMLVAAVSIVEMGESRPLFQSIGDRSYLDPYLRSLLCL